MPTTNQTLGEDDARALSSLIERHRDTPGGLLPLLHDLQDRLGHVPEAAVEPIAQALGLSRAEVHGVVSFYHFFRTTPPKRHVVQVCQAEACQACGANALMAAARDLAGGGSGQASVTLEPIYCLGLCASSPAVMIDGRLHGRVTPSRLGALMQALGVEA
jgi:formate dehydrogenase subunit gamma